MNNLILTITVFIGTICSFSSAFAQDDYNSEFLIPYNDHGKWGFSDTLGNLKVTPQFESVSFFFEQGAGRSFSFVRRGEESVYYALNKGCVSPVGYKADKPFFRSFFLANNIAVIKKNDKVGLFNYKTQKIVIDVAYTEATPDEENGMIYFSRDDEKSNRMNILAYDVNSNTQKKLNYVEIRTEGTISLDDEVQEYILFRDKRNRWFEFDSGEWIRFPYEDMGFNENFEDYYIRESVTEPEALKKLFNQVPLYRTDKIDGATLYSSIEIGYYQNYQVMWKDHSFGLYRGTSQLLQFSYDFIDIDYEHGFFYLLRDNRMGVYLPGTTYSTIEPKYDLLNFYKKLKVNENWVFVLFKAKMNGYDGYVGENGVEFFNFD